MATPPSAVPANPPPPSSPAPTMSPTPSRSRPFAPPKTEKEIEDARMRGVSQKTQQDTDYCMRLWSEWRAHHQKVAHVSIPPITEQSQSELQHWLSRFILEVRRKDGSEFPANTLHHVVCGIMRYLRWNGKPGLDFFKDADFDKFRYSLDAEMKRLQSNGVGSKRRQAEPLTEEEEEILWQKGLLGDSSPQTLLDTMLFMHGLYFALRSGKEHRQLRFKPCQVELIERPGERAYLQYFEDISKSRPGGLKGRKVKPKVVKHHANVSITERCFVRLFKLYMQKCPANRPNDAFYLQPLQKPTPDCWYSTRPLGHHSLGKTVARLCKAAGITGFKTNHSLRATAATRLYQSGVDEQVVVERTGHRSVEGVRSYKRTSDQQSEALSDILNCSKKVCTRSIEDENTFKPSNPGFTFNSCTSVTINLQCNRLE